MQSIQRSVASHVKSILSGRISKSIREKEVLWHTSILYLPFCTGVCQSEIKKYSFAPFFPTILLPSVFRKSQVQTEFLRCHILLRTRVTVQVRNLVSLDSSSGMKNKKPYNILRVWYTMWWSNSILGPCWRTSWKASCACFTAWPLGMMHGSSGSTIASASCGRPEIRINLMWRGVYGPDVLHSACKPLLGIELGNNHPSNHGHPRTSSVSI